MRILDRYLLKEMLVPFVLSLFITTSLLFAQQIIRLMELFLNRGVDLLTLGKLFLSILPPFLAITLPVSVLTASIIAFSRLSSDHEIIALKASGVGLGRLFLPVLVFSFVAYLATTFVSLYAQPWGGASLQKLAVKMIKQQISTGLEERTFNTFLDNMTIYVNEIPTSQDLKGVFISDSRNPQERQIITAQRGTMLTDPSSQSMTLRLFDGRLYRKGKDPLTYQWMIFSSYDLKINLPSYLHQPITTGERPTLQEIRDNLLATQDSRWLRHLEDYYKNFTFPFACFIFGFMGVPLGTFSRGSGRLGAFALGITVAIIYYLMTVTSDLLVASMYITPLLGSWLPNLLLGAMTGLFMVATARETRLPASRDLLRRLLHVSHK